MRLAALFSGGKDSTFAIYNAQKQGHKVVVLATIRSENHESYMYHTCNIGLTMVQSAAMNIPLETKNSKGKKEEEVEDLKALIKNLKAEFGIEGVCCGALASNYQKTRVENICKELDLELIAPSWGADPETYMKDIVNSGFEVIITSVSADGLDKSWLGKKITLETIEELKKINEKTQFHLAFEGGEAETAVLDCPLFKTKIEITDSEIVWEKDNTGQFLIKDAKLVVK